jgi:regulator of nucleoside diphosphate kinase
MSRDKIYITRVDADKIRMAIIEAEHSGYRGTAYIQSLKEEVERAEIVEPRSVPPDVITLNTTAALLDIETDETMKYTLVLPEEADVSQGKISILAPIGTAMLGYRVGDVFEWDTPGGKVKIKVSAILDQPEAKGKFD